MEKCKEYQTINRRHVELAFHTPNPCDSFTDPQYESTVTYRSTLAASELQQTFINNFIDLVPLFPSDFYCESHLVDIDIKAFICNNHSCFMVLYKCHSKELGKRIFNTLDNMLS